MAVGMFLIEQVLMMMLNNQPGPTRPVWGPCLSLDSRLIVLAILSADPLSTSVNARREWAQG